MVASNQKCEVENIHSILNTVVNKLAGLPVEQKDEITKDLQLLQSCVGGLLEERDQTMRTVAELQAANRALAARAEDQAALERQKRLEQLNDLLDNAQEPIFVLDNDWNYIFANRNHHKNLGKEPGYLIGKNFWEENPEVSGTPVEYHLRKAREEGRPSHGRLVGVYVPVWFNFSAFPTPYGVSVFSYDLSEQVLAEQALQEVKTNLEVQHRLEEQREQERQMIARDIHDGPIQTLVSTMYNLQMVKEALNDPQMEVELNQVGLTIKHTIQELRYLVNDLRPPAVLHFGLSRMIRLHGVDFMERYPELEFDHILDDDHGRLPENTCLMLYRIYQEALANIVRHAQARRVIVRFSIVKNVAILEIEDDGKGFAVIPDLISQTAKGHYGMAGMKERAEAAGGAFLIESSPGTGTTIKVRIPVKGARLVPKKMSRHKINR